MKDWIEVFRAGTHTTAAGDVLSFTEADLDAVVQNYKKADHEAPVVIGHPTMNAPAWGWVSALKREGKSLYAKFQQVQPEFAEMVEKGLFKKRSIALYPGLKLRHVGFLGAMPPAVKGLADIQFAEGDAVTVEFSDGWKMSMVGRMFQRMRDYLIEKEGVEKADTVVYPYEVEQLLTPEPEEVGPEYNESDRGGDMDKIAELTQQLKEFGEKLNTAEARATTAEARVLELETKIAADAEAGRKAHFENFCEGLIKEGRMLPAEKTGAVITLMALDTQNKTFEFGEGDKKVEKTLVQMHMDNLKASPIKLEFGERTDGKKKPAAGYGDFPGDVDPERMAIHQRAVELMESKQIDYNTAVMQVMEG